MKNKAASPRRYCDIRIGKERDCGSVDRDASGGDFRDAAHGLPCISQSRGHAGSHRLGRRSLPEVRRHRKRRRDDDCQGLVVDQDKLSGDGRPSHGRDDVLGGPYEPTKYARSTARSLANAARAGNSDEHRDAATAAAARGPSPPERRRAEGWRRRPGSVALAEIVSRSTAIDTKAQEDEGAGSAVSAQRAPPWRSAEHEAGGRRGQPAARTRRGDQAANAITRLRL